jgi:peptide/nickel transport system ATP-binding protein
LQSEFGLTYVFVSHNMSVIRYISDRIAVICGQTGRTGQQRGSSGHPRHPYTELLLCRAVAVDRQQERLWSRRWEPPDLGNLPKGCVSGALQICKEICKQEEPQLRPVGDGHFANCHIAEDLSLQGIVPRSALAA